MGYAPSVVVKSEVASVLSQVPYLNCALLTFYPSTSGFLSGFQAGAQYVDPGTGDGLVGELTINNWTSKLKAWGATEDEPIWQQVAAHLFPSGVLNAQGQRVPNPVKIPPRVFIGCRQTSVPSEADIEFTTNTAGTVTVTINKSGNIFDDGYLTQVQVVADGVLTVAQLATALDTALGLDANFAALYTSSAALGVVSIASIADGFPLRISISVTTGGPIMTQTVTTANTPGDYYDDLTLMQSVAELSDDPTTGKPERRWYWISDTQGDDTVNAEGFEWVQDQQDNVSPSRDYQFRGLSPATSNFDPLAVASPSQAAQAANGGEGWNRGGVCFHDLYEWPVSALLGRCIGYLPGEISFTDKVLIGANKYAKITPRNQGDNASLANDRTFDYNTIEGPLGAWRRGWLADGSFCDRKWLEDYATYVANLGLTLYKQRKNIVTFTDSDISAGASVIAQALLTLPAIAQVPSALSVTFLKRSEVSPSNIAARTYVDYTVTAGSGGIIDTFGTIATPIIITISESLS